MSVRIYLERLLVGAITIFFFLPLALAVLKNNRGHLPGIPFIQELWLSAFTLKGVVVATPKVPFSWRALAAGDFQKSQAAQFNQHFPARAILIRWTNEAWFRFFREPASLNSTVAIGAHGALFEKGYLHEYFLERSNLEDHAEWMRDLRRLQDHCQKVGTGFLFVISPNKASMYPEEISLAWRRRYDPRPRGYPQLVELLRRHGIHFVDAPALLAAEQSAQPPPVPFFAKGGAHWNPRATWLVMNAIHAQLRAQGQPLEPVTVRSSRFSLEPQGEDQDLAALMNLARPLSYPCETLSFHQPSSAPGAQPTMAIIGNSFSNELSRTLSASGQFSEISLHYYYKLSKSCAADGELFNVRDNGVPEDFDREIFGADCLLLELNETSAGRSAHYLTLFLKDALAHLPDPSAARPPFRSD